MCGAYSSNRSFALRQCCPGSCPSDTRSQRLRQLVIGRHPITGAWLLDELSLCKKFCWSTVVRVLALTSCVQGKKQTNETDKQRLNKIIPQGRAERRQSCYMCELIETAQSLGDDTHAVVTCVKEHGKKEAGEREAPTPCEGRRSCVRRGCPLCQTQLHTMNVSKVGVVRGEEKHISRVVRHRPCEVSARVDADSAAQRTARAKLHKGRKPGYAAQLTRQFVLFD